MKILKALTTLKNLDFFGAPIQLNYGKRIQFQSYMGALITIIVKGISFYFFIYQMIQWVVMENSTIIYSTENFSVQGLLNDNHSLEYIWDNHNYNIYFVVSTVFPNGSDLSYQELSRYFSINYKYSAEGLNFETIESEPCNLRNTNEFLGLRYDQESIKENQTNKWRMCIKNPVKMGLLADIIYQQIQMPQIGFQISLCVNATENNYNCAPIEAIEEVMKYIVVQASIPKTNYDFKNKSNPIKRMFKNEYYYLDKNMLKKFRCDVNPTFLYKDMGLFNDVYEFQNLNFNPSQEMIDMNTRTNDNPILFQYDLFISFQTETYYIRNQKINDIIGTFGGFISILYSIGGLVALSINKFKFTKSLLNATFRFKKEKHRNSTQKAIKTYKKFIITTIFFLLIIFFN